jgi:anti-anti-sigma factor
MSASPQSLGPELTIPYAAEWRSKLAEMLEACAGNLQLDLGSVTDFDSAGVQLLLATRASLAQRGNALQVTSASPAVRDALALFGLQELLPETATA